MATFKDKSGREWEVRVDAMLGARIRENCDPKFLLGDSFQPDADPTDNTFLRLKQDPVIFCQVLYHLCTKQRETRDLSEEQFYTEVLGDGESIAAAVVAVRDAIVSFTQPPAKHLLVALAEQEEMREQAIQKAVEKINDPALREQVLSKIHEKVDRDFDQVLTHLQNVLNSPDSSESTLAASPSAN